MPAYTTISEAKAFVGSIEEQRAIKSAAASKTDKDTFLSHSSKDNEIVPGVTLVLKNHGGNVYVDLGDDRLPEPPSVDTAQVLRDSLGAWFGRWTKKRLIRRALSRSRDCDGNKMGGARVPWAIPSHLVGNAGRL